MVGVYDITVKNGIIYKDHPFISNIRLMISGMQEMDIDKIRSPTFAIATKSKSAIGFFQFP